MHRGPMQEYLNVYMLHVKRSEIATRASYSTRNTHPPPFVLI
jgi:hypothetical protein